VWDEELSARDGATDEGGGEGYNLQYSLVEQPGALYFSHTITCALCAHRI